MALAPSTSDRSLTERCARYRVIEMADLGAAEIDRWLELRATNSALDSPYFHPGFAAAVAATRPGVRVIIGEDAAGAAMAFLPVQLDGRRCRPVGSPAADFQGPVCAPDVEFDMLAALRACGASSYPFDHMREGVPGLEQWTFGRQQSPFLEVTDGTSGYLTRASRSGKDKVTEARRLTRKASRDLGPVRFVTQSYDVAVLDTVIALKRRQYSLTGSRDYFSDGRHVALMYHLLSERGSDFGGVLSVVYAGPHLLAAHFGLRAGPVLHWWFPVYEPEFSRLSPGWLLLCGVIDAAPELGVSRIDLGRGEDDFKRRAMTGHQVVCQGAVMPGAVRRRAAGAQRRAIAAAKSSRVAPTLRGAVRSARRRSSR